MDKTSYLDNASDVYCLFGSIQDVVLMTVEFVQGSQYNLLIVLGEAIDGRPRIVGVSIV